MTSHSKPKKDSKTVLLIRLSTRFPASRGLSRREEMYSKRDHHRLPTRCLMKPPTRFLVETDRFLKPVPFNVWCACLVRLYADNYWRLQSNMASMRSSSFEISHFDQAIKSSVSKLGDKRLKEITSLQRKVILGFLKGRDTQTGSVGCVAREKNVTGC